MYLFNSKVMITEENCVEAQRGYSILNPTPFVKKKIWKLCFLHRSLARELIQWDTDFRKRLQTLDSIILRNSGVFHDCPLFHTPRLWVTWSSGICLIYHLHTQYIENTWPLTSFWQYFPLYFFNEWMNEY